MNINQLENRNFKTRFSKAVVIILTAAIPFMSAISVCAQVAGTQGSGGGNAHGPIAFDVYENLGSVPVTFDSIIENNSELKTILTTLFSEIPEMRIPGQGRVATINIFKKAAALKSWYEEPKKLDQQGRCKNASMLSVDKQVVACQTRLVVRISKPWLDSTTDYQKAVIQNHEFILSILMPFTEKLGGAEDRDELVRVLNRAILARDFIKVGELFKNELGYEPISARSLELARVANSEIATYQKRFCSGERIEISMNVHSAYENYVARSMLAPFEFYLQNPIKIEKNLKHNAKCVVYDVPRLHSGGGIDLTPIGLVHYRQVKSKFDELYAHVQSGEVSFAKSVDLLNEFAKLEVAKLKEQYYRSSETAGEYIDIKISQLVFAVVYLKLGADEYKRQFGL